jgi:hypothetical protein
MNFFVASAGLTNAGFRSALLAHGKGPMKRSKCCDGVKGFKKNVPTKSRLPFSSIRRMSRVPPSIHAKQPRPPGPSLDSFRGVGRRGVEADLRVRGLRVYGMMSVSNSRSCARARSPAQLCGNTQPRRGRDLVCISPAFFRPPRNRIAKVCEMTWRAGAWPVRIAQHQGNPCAPFRIQFCPCATTTSPSQPGMTTTRRARNATKG